MSKTRSRIFAAAACIALAASANAQEIAAYVPAIALPPEPMGDIPPIPTVSNSTASMPLPAASSSVEAVGFFPTRMSQPNAAPATTAPSSATSLSSPTATPPMSVSGQRWRWYGYGTINGRAAANPAAFGTHTMGPSIMAAPFDAPPVPPATAPPTGTPASIGIPQPMSDAPAPPVTVDGPAMPQAAPEVPAIGPPTVDMQLDNQPRAPIPAPPVEPWGGPFSKAPVTTWQPVVARASSAR